MAKVHKKLFSSTRQALQRQGEFRRGRERLGAEDLPDSSLVLTGLGHFPGHARRRRRRADLTAIASLPQNVYPHRYTTGQLPYQQRGASSATPHPQQSGLFSCIITLSAGGQMQENSPPRSNKMLILVHVMKRRVQSCFAMRRKRLSKLAHISSAHMPAPMPNRSMTS